MRSGEPHVPSRARAAALAAAWLVCACSGARSGDPGPRPLAVQPDRGPEGVPTQVVITGDFRARIFTDYEDAGASTVDARFTAQLGGVHLRDVRLLPDGTLSAIVPETLVPGSHDLTVTGPDGREGTLERAFRVVAAAEADQLVSSYSIMVSGPQQAMAPFRVTITALDARGQTVTAFNGSAALSDGTGTVVPAAIGLFSGGVWTGDIEVRVASQTDVLTVSDTSGGVGRSTVRIDPAPAARLGFASSPVDATAGACAGPVSVQVLDRFGFPTPATQALDVSLAAEPPVTAFSDATCQTAASPSAMRIAAGAGTGTAWLRVTQAGTFSLQASASAMAPASQALTVRAGPSAALAWDPIASPQVQDAPFAVVLRAQDAYGNPTPSFTGTATLSITPDTVPLACARNCTSASETAPFVGGTWSGEIAVGAKGAGRTVVGNAPGLAQATSTPFDVLGGAPSPPIARLSVAPAVRTATIPSTAFAVDASRSSDWDTPAAALEVSWDCTGVATTEPGTEPQWTQWTTTKTATCAFDAPGTYSIRLAVKDGDQNVSYASADVVVLAASSQELCVVDTAADVDDLGTIGSSTTCATKGADGKLSLAEAIRISNARAGTQVITFAEPMTISGSGTYTVTDAVEIRAPSGVSLVGKTIDINTMSAVLVSGLELRGQTTPVLMGNKSNVTFKDVSFEGTAGISMNGSGNLTLQRVRMVNCASACVQIPPSNSSPGKVLVLYSELRNSGGTGTGVSLSRCNPAQSVQSATEIQSTVFAGFATAVRIDPACIGPTLIRNDTFVGNGQAIVYGSGGSGHDLRSNIFVGQTVATTDCTGASFAVRSHNLEHGGVTNAPADCVGNPDPFYDSRDPLFVFPLAADYRLQSGSPAVDSGDPRLTDGTETPRLDLNDAAPGFFTGAGPDRGGRETW